MRGRIKINQFCCNIKANNDFVGISKSDLSKFNVIITLYCKILAYIFLLRYTFMVKYYLKYVLIFQIEYLITIFVFFSFINAGNNAL